jgi:hypothetical protein
MDKRGLARKSCTDSGMKCERCLATCHWYIRFPVSIQVKCRRTSAVEDNALICVRVDPDVPDTKASLEALYDIPF